VAPDKFLAKIACDIQKPGGFVVVAPERVSENPGGPQGDDAELKVQESQVIGDPLLPVCWFTEFRSLSRSP